MTIKKTLQAMALGLALPLSYGCGSDPVRPEPIVTVIEEGSVPSEVTQDEQANGEQDDQEQYAAFDGEVTAIANDFGLPVSSAYAYHGSNIGSSPVVLYLSNFSSDLTNTTYQLFSGRLENVSGVSNPDLAAQNMLETLIERCAEMGVVENGTEHIMYLAYLPKGAKVEGQTCLEQQSKLTTAQLVGTPYVDINNVGDNSLIEAIYQNMQPKEDELPPGFAPTLGGYEQ